MKIRWMVAAAVLLTAKGYAGPINFEDADANQDGMLTEAEFAARHQAENPQIPAGTVKSWFQKKDMNRDGELTQKEFLSDR